MGLGTSLILTNKLFTCYLKVTTYLPLTNFQLNINDNAPLFPHALSRRIEEDTPVGSLITSIAARDGDVDGQVEYALAAPSSYFELQRATGDLVLLKELDFEQQVEHVLSVQVSFFGSDPAPILDFILKTTFLQLFTN